MEKAQNNKISFDKVPPQDIDSERAVLGACLMPESTMLIAKLQDIITNFDVFYSEKHRHIWNAILSLYSKNKPADLITLTTELDRTGDLEKIDVAYLDEMIDATPSASNAEYYAEQVVEAYKRRKLLQVSAAAYSSAFDQTEDVSAILDKTESEIFAIRNMQRTKFISEKDALSSALQDIEDAGKGQTGLKTGLADLDHQLIGMRGGQFIIIAGRPGMGKTVLAMNIARNVAETVPVGIFSLEMDSSEIAKRMLSAEANIDHAKLERGGLSHDDWLAVADADISLKKLPIFYDSDVYLTETMLRSKTSMLVNQHQVGVIIIDYIQLMGCSIKTEQRYVALGIVSRALKGIAREFNIPVIGVAQLNRATETRPDKRPNLGDLRECGNFEADANKVILLYRDEYYDKDSADKGIAECIVAKNRNGETGTIKVAYLAKYMKFGNYERHQR